MPGTIDELFDVDVGTTETGGRLVLSLIVGGLKIFAPAHYAHAPPAATRCGFDDQRITDLFGRFLSIGERIEGVFGSGKDGYSCFAHRSPRAGFVAHQANRVGRRSNEGQS